MARDRTILIASLMALGIGVAGTSTSRFWAQGPKPNLAPEVTKRPAAVEAKPSQPVGKSETHELTAADLEVYLDGLMPMALQREDIAGGVVAVVKDGKLLFEKGYGYSDVAKKTPVIPDATLFRPGSISKLFTWTAVMQQVEQGKLDLDRDVNDYLDFKIPATYPQPIKLRNLMTHTPGFEESVKNLILKDASHLEPLGQYLGAHIPRRIYPPGPVPAYSNYGAALAGHIVERTTGRPFARYVEDSIFKPLGMTRASFDQPLPEALKPLMSSGYNEASDPAQPFEVIEDAPAGALSVTAEDIAHFMIAHLQDGQFNGSTILRPETVRLMHSRQSGPSSALNGMCLGFYEQNRNGHRVISHGGDTIYFHSDMYLVLDAGVGLFVSLNSAGKRGDPRGALYEKFMDRYFPDSTPPEPTLASAAQDAKSVSGLYMSSRREETTILSVESAFDQTEVSANPDGTISVEGLVGYNRRPKHLREIAPLVFKAKDGSDRVAFTRDEAGRRVLALDFPIFIFQQVPWYKNTYLNQGIFWGSLGVFGLALLFWPLAAIFRRHYDKTLDLTSGERRARLRSRIVCMIDVVFLLAWIAYGSFAGKDFSLLSSSFDRWLRLMELAGMMVVFGTPIAIHNCLKAWGNPNRWFWSKPGETLIALASVGLTWFIFNWHMLTLSLNY
ncbi:MAG TPA: serine hydrolase [Terriglobia bacterium]|nr:serine hydrolase [Terriglobia bacterium]